MSLIGIKPFWDLGEIERQLHIGFCSEWYDGEWFQFSDEDMKSLFLEGFDEFSDSDRDVNSVDFIYWFNSNGMAEFVIEQQRQGLSLNKFRKQESGSRKHRP